jgi:DNA-directed RNA polymerase subunit L
MTEPAQMIPAKTIDIQGFRMKFEMKDVPVQFVNAIRRTLLNEMPVVEVGDVKILTNTTLMPHEMLQLRTELLPVNVRPTEEDLIRSIKLTLQSTATEDVKLYTSDFVVSGGRSDILLKDRDLDTPLYFLKMKKDEAIYITAGLRVNPASSHCCVATYSYHVDEEQAKEARETFEGGPALFDNFYRQRYYHKNAKGRPDWFDVEVESIGVIPARELVKEALQIIKRNVIEWTRNEVVREKEENVYKIISESGGITVGALIQAILYESNLCNFVSYDRPHPLRSDIVVRFLTESTPEAVMTFITQKITQYCDVEL